MRNVFVLISLFVLLASAACTGLPGTGITTEPTTLPTLPGAPTLVPTIQPSAQPTVAQPTAAPSATALPTVAQPTAAPTSGIPNVPPIPVATSGPVVQPTVAVPPQQGLDDFALQLTSAIERKDFPVLRTLMNPRFSIATYQQTLYEYTSEEALSQLQSHYLSSGSQPAARWGTDLVALLSGGDPLAQWGPVANVVRGTHVMGLGALADSEAILVIGRDAATGRFYWHGILLPQNGRFFTDVLPSGDALPTNITMIQALDVVRMRSGPGLNYATEGLMRQGETAQVTGISADGNWYQVYCTMDASGHCWVTSDGNVTLPIATKP